jgi:hypothetical protein
MNEHPFESATFGAIIQMIERMDAGLRSMCLMQADTAEGAKHIEWYRGGAQVLSGLRGEMELERDRRLAEAEPTPEQAIDESLKVLERNKIRWSPTEPPDPNAEL